MKVISIDSSHMDEVIISVDTGEQVLTEKKQARNIKGSQVILQTLDALLAKAALRAADMEEIRVHAGPGSYTGLRVGAAIGNTLAFCLEAPINQQEKGTFVYPSYE